MIENLNSWLLENFYKYENNHKLLEAFNNHFNIHYSYDTFKHKCEHLNLLRRTTKTFTWNEEDTQWLINNYNKLTIEEMVEQYNKNHSNKVSYAQIKHKMQLLGLIKQHSYTKEQDQWLIDNINKYSRKDIVKEFNKHFSMNRTELSIKTHCNRKMKIYFNTNIERRKKEIRELYLKRFPIGTELNCNGITWIKIDNNNWYIKSRYINGIPKHCNKVVYVLDSNKSITKENTYVANSETVGIMTHYNFHHLPPKLKHLAIKNCQLETILKGE